MVFVQEKTVLFHSGLHNHWFARTGRFIAAFCCLALFSFSQAYGETTTRLDFDNVDATHGRVVATGYLAKAGITLSGVTTGTLVVIFNAKNFYEGRALVAPSSPNVLTQINSNDPVSFTLNLPASAQSVKFTRPALLAGPTGITFPEWRAQALNDKGKVVDEVGEQLGGYYSDHPARTFTLKGPGIKAIRFNSRNMHFAAFNAVAIDDLTIISP